MGQHTVLLLCSHGWYWFASSEGLNETLPFPIDSHQVKQIWEHQVMWCKTIDLWPLNLLQFVSSSRTAPTPGQSHTNSNVVLISKGCQAVQSPSFGRSWAKHRSTGWWVWYQWLLWYPKESPSIRCRPHDRHMSYTSAFDFRVTVNGQHCLMDRDSGQWDKTQGRICSGSRP